MSLLSVLVLVGSLHILRRLSGDAELDLKNVGETVSLDLTSVLPSLTIEEIPLKSQTGEEEAKTSPTDGWKRDSAVVQPKETATPVPRGGEIDLTFGGTVAVETSVRQSGYYSESKRYDFSDLLSLLHGRVSGDYAMLSLENIVVPGAKVSDLIVPEEVMGLAVGGGFDCVALGFGRVYDKGMDGVTGTLLAAESAGLDVTGAYMHEGDAALAARIRTVGNLKVAFLHYTETLTNTGKKLLRRDGNTFAVSMLDTAEQDIAIVRDMGADLVIVSVHWGSENKAEVTASQKSTAERLAIAGADVIVGNGPRRVQRVEYLEATVHGRKHRTLCAYSLGCLLSSSNQAQALQSVLLHVHAAVGSDGQVTLRADYTPTFIWRYKQENLLRFRVIASDSTAPDGMTDEQKKKMASALASVQKILTAFPFE